MHGGIHFNIKEMEFADRDAAVAWIADNQLGRRNLHVLDREALTSIKREALARQARRRQATSTGGVNPQLRENLPQADIGRVRDIIGKELGVSGRQVDKLHEINTKASQEIKQQIRDGKKSVNAAFNEIKERERKQVDLSAKAHLKKAEERHEDFQNSKTVSIDEAIQDRKDAVEIARSKSNEIYTAIKRILFIGASNFDYSIINNKTMDETEIRRLQGEIDIAIGVLKKIKGSIRR